MSALLASLLLLAVDAALLTAGARLTQPAFTVASLLLFPFVLTPLYRSRRHSSRRHRSGRAPAVDRRRRRRKPTGGSTPPDAR